jgi:tetratricopeptide (TPR) repeat protein
LTEQGEDVEMDGEMFTRVLRGNWHLISLMMLICGAGIWMAVTPEKAGDVDAVSVDTEMTTNLTDPDLEVDSRWSTPTKDKKVAAAIEQYESELKYNRGNEDTPHNLYRLANLYYSSVGDFDKAALYYEALIQEHPDYEGIKNVYPNLVACYERLGEDELRRATLRRMMEYFGPNSQEYVFAKQELGL